MTPPSKDTIGYTASIALVFMFGWIVGLYTDRSGIQDWYRVIFAIILGVWFGYLGWYNLRK